jgi:glycosyltransferase involved in cell wall biosynthesis
VTPTFSVIICTYNRASVVGGAIQCVLDQTFDDYELLVVDDGSEDDTQQVVQGFTDPRVRYVRRENGGLSAARNTGAAEARGRYVGFLDDDDWVKPKWLERFAAVLVDDDYAVVSCGAEVVDPAGTVVNRKLPADLGPAFDNLRGLFLAGTFFVTREAYLEAGGFAESMPASHQTEFSLRLLPLCTDRGWRVGTVDEYLLRFNLRPAEHRSIRAPRRALAASEYLIERHGARLARSPRALADVYAVGGVAAARLGQFATARRLFRAAVRNSGSAALRRRNWMRYLLSWVPPVGQIVWRTRAFDT